MAFHWVIVELAVVDSLARARVAFRCGAFACADDVALGVADLLGVARARAGPVLDVFAMASALKVRPSKARLVPLLADVAPFVVIR